MTTIVPFPLYHARVINHDYEVSLEKLGQNNLVHCPQKLELPFLPLSLFHPLDLSAFEINHIVFLIKQTIYCNWLIKILL